MQDLMKELKNTLLKDDRFFKEDALFKNVVIEFALKLDKDLLKMLYSNETIRKHFFTRVDDITIFDKDKFIRFVSNKEFLPDSFTSFKNKIGLMINDKYFSEIKDVILAWPYKDCVLEGGMTKEDQKRDEVFYNEILAPDDISRLFDPKVLTCFKKYDANGEHAFKRTDKIHFENENLVIKGNNLLALHSLKKRYAGKVKLIYIDPPYNTGNDSFKYNDNFNHSTWLTFMKNRLKDARELLSIDGSIYIQLDYNEIHYFKVLMDEIFGKQNFQREIIWYLSGAAGYKSLVNSFIRGHDSILYYSKSEKVFFNKEFLPYDEDQLKRFSKSDENGRKYKTITKDKKIFLDEAKGVPVSDVWLDIASFQTVVNSPEMTGFKTQKPEKLKKRIINSSSLPGDIILDFSAGSGTTGSTAHKLGRKYILIEQMENQIDIINNRLQKVIKGDTSGISNEVNWKGGGSFIYFELMQWNEIFINKIQKAKSTKELIAIWEEIKNKAFLSYKVDIKKTEENISMFKDLSVENQKKFLIEVLDKNSLYVNYSEIDDKEYNVRDDDKKLNKMFYMENA